MLGTRMGFESALAIKANRVAEQNTVPDIIQLQSLRPISIGISANYSPPVGNYLISVGASTAPITITLPTATSGLDRTYVITKVDSTAHAIIIASSGGSIAGETSQSLLLKQESLSFFSDGTNWQVR